MWVGVWTLICVIGLVGFDLGVRSDGFTDGFGAHGRRWICVILVMGCDLGVGSDGFTDGFGARGRR